MTVALKDILTSLGPNHHLVIQLLRRLAPISRAELCDHMNVTQAAVSMLVRDLIKWGYVLEGDRRQGRRGPPQIDLKLNADSLFSIGIHADLHGIYLSLVDFSGKMRAEVQFQNRFETFEAAKQTITHGARDLLEKCGHSINELVGAGLAIPTTFSADGIGISLAEDMHYWRGSDVAKDLSTMLGCPVMVENDASAASVGELTMGNPDGKDSFFYVYLSGGIGGAIVINGQLFRGERGNAGEIGSLRKRTQSRPSFDDLVFEIEKAGLSHPEGRDNDIWESFLETIPELRNRWIERAAQELTLLIHATYAILDLPTIYVGGTLPFSLRSQLCEKVRQIWPEKKQTANSECPMIQPSLLKTRSSAAYGAGALVLHRVAQEGNTGHIKFQSGKISA